MLMVFSDMLNFPSGDTEAKTLATLKINIGDYFERVPGIHKAGKLQ